MRHARVYILLLNPGFTADECRYEAARQDCRQELNETLGGSRPWLFQLDRFQDQPMRHRVWQRFGEDIGPAAAAAICTLHCVPYHAAKRPPAARLAKALPSALAMRRFVQDSVLPGARAGRCGVIVARGASLYGITPAAETDGLLVNDPEREARTGRETPGTHQDREGQPGDAPRHAAEGQHPNQPDHAPPQAEVRFAVAALHADPLAVHGRLYGEAEYLNIGQAVPAVTAAGVENATGRRRRQVKRGSGYLRETSARHGATRPTRRPSCRGRHEKPGYFAYRPLGW